MSRYLPEDYHKQGPSIQMAPLIDIVFLTLVFFMTISVFNQQEAELSISVPKSSEAAEALRSPGEIIINIRRTGDIIVNQRKLSQKESFP